MKCKGDRMDQQPQPNSTPQYTAPDTSQSQLTPSEPPKGKKTGLMVAVIAIVVVVVGAIVFMILGSDKKDTGTTSDGGSSSNSTSNTANSDKFQKYDVADKSTGVNYSVS